MADRDQNSPESKPKDEMLRIRADSEQVGEVRKRLKGSYSLSALIRALLEKWLDQGSDLVNADDLERHSGPAPKGSKKKGQKK